MATYEQAVLPIHDPQTFSALEASIAGVFASANVPRFLRAVERKHLRIRDFAAILAAGLFGPQGTSLYQALDDADRGQIRERYLHRIEQVPMELRAKHLKLYAYY